MDKTTFNTTTFVKDMKVETKNGRIYTVEGVFFNSYTFKVKSDDGIDSYIKSKDVVSVIHPFEGENANVQLEMYMKQYKEMQEKFNKRTAMNTRLSSLIGNINALISKMDSALNIQQNVSYKLNQFHEQMEDIKEKFYEGNRT